MWSACARVCVCVRSRMTAAGRHAQGWRRRVCWRHTRQGPHPQQRRRQRHQLRRALHRCAADRAECSATGWRRVPGVFVCLCVCVFGWWGRGCCGLLEHAQIAVVALVTEAQLAVTPRCRGRLKIGSASPRESLRASFCTAKSCAACSDEAVCDTDRRLPVHLCITSSHCPVALAVAFVAPAASTYVLSPARPTRPTARLAQLLLRRVRGCVLHALLR